MKKKLLFGILMVAILTCLFAISINAEWIDGVDYTLNSNGTATVSSLNRTECQLKIVKIPEQVKGADGKIYTVTAIADRCFGSPDENASNTYIEELYIPSTVTSISGQMIRRCPAIKKLKIDAQVTSIAAGMAWDCPNLEEIDLSGMTKLTTLGQIATSCPNLKTVKLPSSVTTIDSKAFQSCGLTSLVLPEGVTTIGGNCFQSNEIQTLVLPSTLNSVGGAAFHGLSTVKTLVFANTSFDGWSTNVVFNSVNPSIIFFAGEDPSTLTTHYTQWASYETMSFEDYLANPSAVADKKVIVYDTLNCEKCGYVKVSEEEFNFTSFTEKMVVGKTCAHCLNVEAIKTYSAMFECRGFSVSENGNEGITISFTVNGESVAGYKTETERDVSSYGLFVGIESLLGSNDIMDKDGKVSNGAFVALIENEQFSILQLKIAGFEGELTTSKFAFGAYVVTKKDEESTLSYMQTSEPNEGEKYYYTTYNDLVNA